MQTKYITVVGVLLAMAVLAVAGIGTGIVILSNREAAPVVTMPEDAGIARNIAFTNKPSTVVTVEVTRVDEALNQELSDLRMTVSKLQAELAEKEAALAERGTSTNRPSRRGGEGWNFKDRLEKMKEEQPEQHKELMSRIDSARDSVRTAFAEKAFFLNDRDTSQMNEEELAAYTNMVGLLNKTWALTEKMGEMDMPMAERWQTMGAMRSSMQELTPLMEQQRTQEFKAVGTSLGYDEKESDELAEYLDGVVEATTMDNVFSGVRNMWRPSRSNAERKPSGEAPAAMPR